VVLCAKRLADCGEALSGLCLLAYCRAA
jgi:hypothetical protein